MKFDLSTVDRRFHLPIKMLESQGFVVGEFVEPPPDAEDNVYHTIFLYVEPDLLIPESRRLMALLGDKGIAVSDPNGDDDVSDEEFEASVDVDPYYDPVNDVAFIAVVDLHDGKMRHGLFAVP